MLEFYQCTEIVQELEILRLKLGCERECETEVYLCLCPDQHIDQI